MKIFCAGLSMASVGAGLLFAASATHGGIFSRVEAGTGVVVYSNLATGAGSQEVTSAASNISAPLKTGKAIRPRLPAEPTDSNAQQQRARDVDRRAILTTELRAEQGALRSATLEHATPEVIVRHQSNLAALEREISRVR